MHTHYIYIYIFVDIKLIGRNTHLDMGLKNSVVFVISNMNKD